jgi:hypothetical protein
MSRTGFSLSGFIVQIRHGATGWSLSYQGFLQHPYSSTFRFRCSFKFTGLERSYRWMVG